MSSLREEVDDHLQYMFDVQLEGPARPRQLRTSALPYCPILDVLSPREPEAWDVKGTLYTSMGTAAHAALQLFATVGAPGARVWGNWKCPKCSHEWKTPQFRPRRCPTGCQDNPTYVELTFRYGSMSGHCDLVVKYPSGWVVHEYKTIGSEPRSPKRQHLLQARTYCTMLRRQHRISASYAIIYLGREKLDRWVFGPYDSSASSQQMNDWCNRAVHGFRAATVARKRPERPNLLEVARLRPCTDRESHDAYMGRRYEFSRKRCQMLPHCSISDAHVANVITEMLE